MKRFQFEYVVEMMLDVTIADFSSQDPSLDVMYSCRCSDCRRYEVTSNNKGHGRPVEKVDLTLRVR